MSESSYCGFVTLLGRSNVGKSTLMNALVGEKISITANKPQTTREQIYGIHTQGQRQAIYVDTPGLHKNAAKALNRQMNRAAARALSDVDVVILVVEALMWTSEDQWALEKCLVLDCPIIVAINKVDTVRERRQLLPYLASLSQKGQFAEIIPVSASTQENLDILSQAVAKALPPGPHLYATTDISNKTLQFRVAEAIREPLVRALAQELPYAIMVTIDRWQMQGTTLHIDATIWVERAQQKAIVIGKKGLRLKQFSSQARTTIEALLGQAVFLRTWVRVKENWSNNQQALSDFGL